MFNFDLEKMLFTIPVEKHSVKDVTEILNAHPEVKFVSFVGIDIAVNATDEKIPVAAFIKDMQKMLQYGVQTDGSSVVLPKIADLNDAKVDIIPDSDANWYVDHNLSNVDFETGLPVGTLRIPAMLVHNEVDQVGSRVVLRDCVRTFETQLLDLLHKHPYVFENLGVGSADDIEEIVLTSATELEFWVKTPDEEADRDHFRHRSLFQFAIIAHTGQQLTAHFYHAV